MKNKNKNTIQVTQDDIDKGTTNYVNCPIARAFSRERPFGKDIDVSVLQFCIIVENRKGVYEHNATDFIKAFDNKQEVKPMTVEWIVF